MSVTYTTSPLEAALVGAGADAAALEAGFSLVTKVVGAADEGACDDAAALDGAAELAASVVVAAAAVVEGAAVLNAAGALLLAS